MKIQTQTNQNKKLYEQLYLYFKTKIIDGSFPANSKLPSIRKCAAEFGISKTTVETAYLQLATEGFVVIKPQSGYYVCRADFSGVNVREREVPDFGQETSEETQSIEVISDFNFELWQKYLKSTLSNNKRLTGYGHPQGEPELRAAVCEHLINSREVYCKPENLVIGAGTQTLLHLLFSLCDRPKNVAIIGKQFPQGEAVLKDHGAEVTYLDVLPANLDDLIDSDIKMIYLFPARMNNNAPLQITDRIRLLQFAAEHSVTVIEDDYNSEILRGPIAPSLQGLDAGRNVVYLGTFSKLLLPGIRISFMVLPPHLTAIYKTRMHLYNQTASKLEQLALSAFIRDGRLEQQLRKTKRRNKSQ